MGIGGIYMSNRAKSKIIILEMDNYYLGWNKGLKRDGILHSKNKVDLLALTTIEKH